MHVKGSRVKTEVVLSWRYPPIANC